MPRALLLSLLLLLLLPTAALACPRPSDPLLPVQPTLYRNCSGLRGVWAHSQGRGVLVAVVDSGVDLQHPDLRANLWRNPGEIPGNRRDDDRNGYVDDLHGVNVLDGGSPQDQAGHGTAVAGLIAARSGNRRGIAGAAGRAQLMAVRVLDAKGEGRASDLIAGIRYAVQNHAQVINLSLNSDSDSSALRAALQDAHRSGVLVVASAGNHAQNLDQLPSFPAQDPHVLAVAASGPGGRLAPFSNLGPQAVELMAPGSGLWSTRRGGGYAPFTGTSASAAVVSGTAALLLGAGASPVRAQRALRRSARPRAGVAWGQLQPLQAWQLLKRAGTGKTHFGG